MQKVIFFSGVQNKDNNILQTMHFLFTSIDKNRRYSNRVYISRIELPTIAEIILDKVFCLKTFHVLMNVDGKLTHPKFIPTIQCVIFPSERYKIYMKLFR